MIVANYLMLSVVMTLVWLVYPDYLHGEIDTEMGNGFEFYIGFDVMDSSWVNLYLVDTSLNKLAISSGEVRPKDRTRHFICQFNGARFNLSVERDDRYVDGYWWGWFRIGLSKSNNNLYDGYYHYNDPSRLLISNISAVPTAQPGAFSGFPAARNFTRDEHKIFVWMGSIGPSSGHNKYGSANRSIGCIRLIHVNYKLIKWMSNGGEYFSYSCWKHASQNICNRGKCHNDTIRYHILDCSSMSVMNTKKYCWESRINHLDTKYCNCNDKFGNDAQIAWFVLDYWKGL